MMPEHSTKPYGNLGGGFEFRTLYELFLKHYGWFILSVFVFLAGMYLHLAKETPIYRRSAVLLVKEDAEEEMMKTMPNWAMLDERTNGSCVDDEKYILTSNQLVSQVVDALHLDVEYSQEQGLRNVALFRDLPFDIRFGNPFDGTVHFDITAVHHDGLTLQLFDEEGKEIPETLQLPYDTMVNTPVGDLLVHLQDTPGDKALSSPIHVRRIDSSLATYMLRQRIEANAISKYSTLVHLDCYDEHPKRAEAILASLMEEYRKSLIEDKNKVAAKTSDFIEERIRIIGGELSEVEEELTAYKQQEGLVDIRSKANTSVAEGAKAKDKSIELTAQLNVAQFVRDFVADISKQDQLIPNITGVHNVGVEQQIRTYNELLLRRNRLMENSGKENTVVEELNQDLMAMRSTIEGSLNTYCETTALQIEDARKEERRSELNIRAIPLQEKKVLDVERQQDIKEKLYTYLLQNWEELAMQLAGTEANLRIVEKPYGSPYPVSPRTRRMMGLALLMGLAFPYLFIFLYRWANMKVCGRKDVERYTTIPVLGEIPRRDKKHKDADIVVTKDSHSHISEAFRILRSTLCFFRKDAKVLMFTSTMAHEGKTFVSRNFAVTLALTGKRVILVDTDLRKGKQGSLLSLKRLPGLSNYLSGNSDDLESLILPHRIADLVDVLPAGVVPPNPSELLLTDRMQEMLRLLREQYDYIILDNVPAMVVADATIVGGLADATLYVIRDRGIDRRYLPELEHLHESGVFKNMGIVLNDVQPRNSGSTYGYGKGYGYYVDEKN